MYTPLGQSSYDRQILQQSLISTSLWRRSLGYRDDTEKKPSHMEMVTVQATAGMVAGACSSVITTPIDTVKTRLQVYKNLLFWGIITSTRKKINIEIGIPFVTLHEGY